MRRATRVITALFLSLAVPTVALAHGGDYTPPAPTGPMPFGRGDSGPQIPPGTADPPSPSVTRWEAWWAANKHSYLRLAERMREQPVGSARTPGANEDEPDPEEVRRRRELDDAAVRESLVPLFIEGLGDKSFEVRTAAAIALGKTMDSRGLAPLRAAAEKDDHKDVRESAILGLGLIGQEDVVPYLDGVLNDRSQPTRTRSFAAFSLGMIGGDSAMVSLKRFLDPKQGPKFVGGLRRQPALMASIYVALGLINHAESPAMLKAALREKGIDQGVRPFIVLSLGRTGDRGSLALLTGLVRTEKDTELRRSAVIALGKIADSDDQEAVNALFRTLETDRDAVARQFAAVALGNLANGTVKARLRALLPKATNQMRPFVALALGLARDLQAAPQLRKYLAEGRDESYRGGLCVALSLMGDRAAVPLLERVLDQKGRPWLQGYAAISLGMLGATNAAPHLRERLADVNDRKLKMNLAVALGLMHDPEATRFLRATLTGDGTIYERGTAAVSLGVLGINAAQPDLMKAYRNKKDHDLVRAFAMVSMGILADASPVPKLSRFSADNNYSITVDPLSEVLSIL